MDISEQCNHSIEEQIELFNNIKPLFTNKPLIVILNKVDIIRPEELQDEKQQIIKTLETEEGLHDYYIFSIICSVKLEVAFLVFC